MNSNAKAALKPFALGTSVFPVPIAGLGGPLVWSSGGVSTLTPIPKTGFIAKLRFNFSGTYTFSTAGASLYNPPFWRVIQNYTLQNSLNYPFRSMQGDDLWFWQQIMAQEGGMSTNATTTGGKAFVDDGVTASNAYKAGTTTSTAQQTFAWQFEDWIGHNDGVNFSRYLLAAMTTSNDLTVNMTWAAPVIGNAATSALTIGDGTAVISQFAMACQVSAEYLTVPDPSKYSWPRRNLVQQIVCDHSYQTAAVGLNSINLTPIQGPEFLGLGIQVINAGGVTRDTLQFGTTGISEIDIYVNGSIPLYQFTFADLMKRYELMYSKVGNFGYVYIDFSNDLGLVNAMSHTHRKVLSTAKYSQISVNVTLNANFTAGAGSSVNLFKRTQQSYAQNQ